MCNCTGKRGKQGFTGAAGTSGITINNYVVTTGTIGSSTTKTIFASAASSGTLIFWGHISMTDTSKNTATITPLINGSPDSDSVAAGTLDSKNTIQITGSILITAGQAFALRVTLNSYSGFATVDSGVILYAIV